MANDEELCHCDSSYACAPELGCGSHIQQFSRMSYNNCGLHFGSPYNYFSTKFLIGHIDSHETRLCFTNLALFEKSS